MTLAAVQCACSGRDVGPSNRRTSHFCNVLSFTLVINEQLFALCLDSSQFQLTCMF